ncbi:hypothetical protein DYB38_007526 [Aphanomyces astaci]|uniref:Uncharacterized protein n=1 Tax=Aphanomyces astaci TaxID=112090 RepID=A0A397EFM8_APHAT|nr:hypothetical protein DYB36_001522 [Aphanomyces astaci]RHY78376.1 hypothetical protein DYB38_007526 [Aphanomyces astaci]
MRLMLMLVLASGEWLQVTLPTLVNPNTIGADDEQHGDDDFNPAATATSSSLTYEMAGMFTPYAVGKQGPTQSTRKLGTSVGWEQKCERHRQQERSSLHGLQRQLANPSLSINDRRRVEVQLVETLKGMYKRQQEALINDEIEREQKRCVSMRLEQSEMGKARLKRQFHSEREQYRGQIERIKEECSMALAATMAKFNMLR